jgi:hypothetical protein
MNIKIMVLWVVILCSLVDRYQRFEGTYCLYLQGIRRGAWNNMAGFSKRLYQTTWHNIPENWSYLRWTLREVCYRKYKRCLHLFRVTGMDCSSGYTVLQLQFSQNSLYTFECIMCVLLNTRMQECRNLVPLMETAVSESRSIVRYRKTIWKGELPGATHLSEMAAQFMQYTSTAVYNWNET